MIMTRRITRKNMIITISTISRTKTTKKMIAINVTEMTTKTNNTKRMIAMIIGAGKILK
jgi:hypothetical protein